MNDPHPHARKYRPPGLPVNSTVLRSPTMMRSPASAGTPSTEPPADTVGSTATWKSWADFMAVVRTREGFRKDVTAFMEAARETVGPIAASRFLETLNKEITSTFDDRLDTAFQAVLKEMQAVAGWQPALLPICPVCQARCKPDQTSTLECGHLLCQSCVFALRQVDPDDDFSDDDVDAEIKCAVCRSFSVCATRLYL